MSDLQDLFHAQDDVKRWRAERENASARLQIASYGERVAYLLSQHDPIASLGLDREKLRIVFNYLEHGNITRLYAEKANLTPEGT